VLIIEIVEKMPNTKAGNHLAGQLLRSGTSPALNYGEAQSGVPLKRDYSQNKSHFEGINRKLYMP
jgi:four helix bundle protein